MKYKYYLFNYPEKYTNIFKKINKTANDLGYAEKCPIENEFNYLVKLYSKRIESELFYLLYIECDKVEEDFLQLIVDYYLTDYIAKNELEKNRFYRLYMIFNVKEFDSTIENYLKYGIKSGNLGSGIHGYNRIPIVFDTKNSKLYVGASDDYSKSYFNKKLYINSMIKPILEYMEEYYHENKLSYKENTKIVTSKSNIYYQDDTYPNKTIYHKYFSDFNKTKIIIVFIITILFYFYLFFVSKEFQIISYIRKILIVLIMGLFCLTPAFISLINNSIKEKKKLSIVSKIKLERDSKLLEILQNLINSKQNNLKNINIVIYKKDIFNNLPEKSVLLVIQNMYQKNKEKIDSYLSIHHTLTLIYNEETNYLKVLNAKNNFKRLKQILKYLK